MNEPTTNTFNWNGFMLGAIVGAAVGAGVALLVAPCSGQETRSRLARGTRDIKEKVTSAFEHAREAARKEASTG